MIKQGLIIFSDNLCFSSVNFLGSVQCVSAEKEKHGTENGRCTRYWFLMNAYLPQTYTHNYCVKEHNDVCIFIMTDEGTMRYDNS